MLLDHAVEGLEEAGAEVLSDRSPGGRSGHLTFVVPGHDSQDVWQRLDDASIVCSPRSGGIRIAPHGYNTADDLQRVVDVVADLSVRSTGPTGSTRS